MNKRIEEAYEIANNAIYFNDNSDYETALYGVCMALKPEIDWEEIGIDFIEDTE